MKVGSVWGSDVLINHTHLLVWCHRWHHILGTHVFQTRKRIPVSLRLQLLRRQRTTGRRTLEFCFQWPRKHLAPSMSVFKSFWCKLKGVWPRRWLTPRETTISTFIRRSPPIHSLVDVTSLQIFESEPWLIRTRIVLVRHFKSRELNKQTNKCDVTDRLMWTICHAESSTR